MIEINEALLKSVQAIAYRAAEQILVVYNEDDVGVTTKDDDSPLTRADLAAHKEIVAGLTSLTPTVPVLSEESEIPAFSLRQQWSEYWLIDPLDGTKEFIAKNPEFTVNIALIRNGVPVLGVVQVPATGVCYLAAEGLDALKAEGEDKPWQTIRARTFQPEESFVVVASRRHGQSELSDFMEAVAKQIGAYELRSVGSALKICLVAEGEADFYPRVGLTSEWDTAAAQAVLEQAGGRMLVRSGSRLLYNAKDTLLNPYFYAVGDQVFDWSGLLAAAPDK